MADSKERTAVPSWDGAARSWRRYTREVAWWVQSVPVYKRRYCGAQLLGRLTGPARLLAMSWSTLVLDSKDGVRVLLTRLATSPLVRKSLPNAAAICQQYFSFKRNQMETIGNFLVRETLVHEEFVEAIIRLYEEKEGVTQDQRDFGLPEDEEEWGEGEWSGSWSWWDYDADYEYEDEGGEDHPPADSGPPEADGSGVPVPRDDGEASPSGAAPGSSPSHRSAPGDTPARSPSRKTAVPQSSAEVPKPVVNELSVTDSFIMGVLRGWRLLQAAGLSAEEKRDILSATKNSLDYEVISAALQNLWDDQLLGHRGHHGSMHMNVMEGMTEDHTYPQYDGYYQEQDDWWWQDQGWHDNYFLGDHSWEDSDGWGGDPRSWEPEALPAVAEPPDDEDPKLKEAQKAEAIAESLAVEAQRTWTEAQRATQALRKDRGFGGPTKCFNCGGNHMVRDCPQRRFSGGFKGKSYGGKGGYFMEPDAYYHDTWDLNYTQKGKSKGKGKKGYWTDMHLQAMWKGKGKSKNPKGKDPGHRSVNAYATDMFVGGLELTDVLEVAASEIQKPVSKPHVGMLDSGATASAAPDAVVQGLISTILSHDRNAKIELDQGLMVDFASGHAMFTNDNSPQIFKLDVNHKGVVWFDLNASDRDLSERSEAQVRDRMWQLYNHSRDMSAAISAQMRCGQSVDPEVEQILVASLKAKATSAKSKAKPLDRSRVMKMDVRDPRAKQNQWPCMGQHTPSAPQANAHGEWVVCSTCNIRLLYTPRQGSSSQHTTVENPAMILRMLRELRPLMGNTLPTAQICRHMLAKINAEEVLNRAIRDVKNMASSSTPVMAGHNTSPATTTASWEVAVPDDDEVAGGSDNHITHYVGKKVMAMSALMVATTMELLVGLQLHERDGLWEISGAPHSWLSTAAEDHGLRPRKINYTTGYDLYQRETWSQLRELRRQHRPRRLWFSLPSSKWSAWSSANYNTTEKAGKLENGRRRERRLLWEANQFIKEALEEDSEVDVYFEWPHPSGGWKQQAMIDLQDHMSEQGVPWLPCRVDGCNYGLRDYDSGQFIKKPWLIRTTDESFHHQFRAKICPGNHGGHYGREGHENDANAYYPWKLVEAITRHWQERTAPHRHVRLLQQRDELPPGDGSSGEVRLNHVLEEHDGTTPTGEDEDYNNVQMVESSRLSMEAMCREARLRQRFDMNTCENILLEYAMQMKQTYLETKPHSRWQRSSFHILLGAYSHRAFSGVSRNSLRYPELNHYINYYLRHWLPQQSWSSISVSLNGKTWPHKDYHNCKGTVNVIHGLGPYEEGGIWLQGEPPPGYPTVRRQCPDGHLRKGYVVSIKHDFVMFSPETVHATQAWRGQRLTITAYTTRLTSSMTKEDQQSLKALGFPLPQRVDVDKDFVKIPRNNEAFPAVTTSSTTTTSDKQPVEGEMSEPSDQERAKWEAQIAKFHKAAGHPTNRNLSRIVKDAGHPEWKVRAALQHHCPACQSLKQGGTSSGQIPPASTHSLYGAWEAVGVDSAEWVPPGSKKKVKFLLFMDLTTKLRVVKPLFTYDFLEMRSESGENLIQGFTEGWLSCFPKPRLLILDAAKSFVSDAVHEFASHVNIQVSYVAEKEAWSHGTLEAGVQDIKMTASAIHLENLDMEPSLTLTLAASSLNATEYTGGFSSFQWAFGREYSLTDEDVRTFATSDYQGEFVKLVQARAKAEEVAKATRAKRVLSKLANTTVRQPLREFGPMELVKVWRKVWPQQQFKGPRGGFRKSGRPHWIGPGRVVFHEVLPHQEGDDQRRHIVWVLIGSQMFRCSVHSVRPVTETEKFQYETSGEDRSSTWKTLADIVPNREYVDLTDQEPEETEVEVPNLPWYPDKSTMVQPTRRVTGKKAIVSPYPPVEPTTPTTSRPAATSSPSESTPGESGATTATRPLEEPVNDYEDPEAKRPRTEPTWVDQLYMEESAPKDTIDIFTAFQETLEFLKVEFDLPPPSSNRQRKLLERNPVLYMVKKMKDSEVVLSRLSERDKTLFHRAKMKEVDSFIKNEAVRKCMDDAELRQAVDSGRIVKARWVLTWKLVPPEDQQEAIQDSKTNDKSVHTPDGTKKAKARIVLLGFQHPSLLDPSFKTASPVQSMLGRNLLYAMAADSQWDLEGLDLATAFLQTQPTEADQELWTTGVHELREALGLDADSVMRVLRNIYGSTTAPRGLWLSLHKTLTNLGAQAVLGERCLWIWLSKTVMDGDHPKTIGAMGGHVDDFHRIGDGSPEWLEIRERINSAYKWGMTKTGSYRHAGTDVSTTTDSNGYKKIVVDQSYYIEALTDVDIEPERLMSSSSLTRADVEACRASLGALQWVAVQSQPQVCARCNLLLTDLVTNGTMETAKEIQQVIAEVRQEPFCLTFQKFPKAKHWSDVVFISMGDQAHANRPKGDSTGGLVTLLAGPESTTGSVCPMSLIGWRTWKLQRKAISSNDAEVQSILEAEDHNFRARLLWSELHGAGGLDVDRPLRVNMISVLENQIAKIKGILCTDSKGGYDAVEINESPLLGLSNMRAALQAFQLRGNLRRAACELRWLASDFDLADALTKKRADCREGLLKFLRTGYWCIRYDPSFTSAKKSKKAGRSAVGTVQEFLQAPQTESDMNLSAADFFWGWCSRIDQLLFES
ncbi:GIP [Symbiodinium sp. CCMP2592]|nr:GIP [Symbiodinium sp. CCMP2592]